MHPHLKAVSRPWRSHYLEPLLGDILVRDHNVGPLGGEVLDRSAHEGHFPFRPGEGLGGGTTQQGFRFFEAATYMAPKFVITLALEMAG
jgi:hypothetical protein